MIEVGILKNFDSGIYKAGVQLAGSLTTYFDDISVAKNIPSSAMVIGNYVIVAIPGGNPKDACVIATWPQGSPGGGSFLDLSDTPSSYSSQVGKIPKVNSAEDALEFTSGWEKIAEVTVTGSAVDYIEFTGLDINTDKFYYLIFNLINAEAACNFDLYCNVDYEPTNYYSQLLRASGTTVTAAGYNAPTFVYIASSQQSLGDILIARNADGYFNYKSYSLRNDYGLPCLYNRVGLKSDSVSNITALRIQGAVSTQIGVGTHLILCKPRTA